ncbi:MAG: helix-turn-helix domain-containing protein [Symploca sp. SIO2D2]|nr:helix-turn-helix domain-containing protein [Symploca sp. SIO2D2]
MNNKTHVGSAEASLMLGISEARVRRLLSQGRIKGATKQGRVWMIPLYEGMPVIIAGGRGPQGTWYKHPRPVETCVVMNRRTISNQLEAKEKRATEAENRATVAEEELEQERQRAKRLEELLREAGINPDENATKV